MAHRCTRRGSTRERTCESAWPWWNECPTLKGALAPRFAAARRWLAAWSEGATPYEAGLKCSDEKWADDARFGSAFVCIELWVLGRAMEGGIEYAHIRGVGSMGESEGAERARRCA